jgi:cobalt-zinc-cadmium efflux system membrane fusion protein
MNRRLTLGCLSVMSLVSCGRNQPPPQEGAAAPKSAVERSGTTADLIRIDAAMLRDLRMTTARVEERTTSPEVDMLGEVDVDRDAYAEVAPPIDAQVVRLAVGQNSVVREGDTLAELRSSELGRARAELMSAEARAELAARTVERKRALAAERIVATRELQQAESELQEAHAAVRSVTSALRALGAEAAGDPASDDPSRFVLRSPMAGIVLERKAVVGQLAQASQPMFRIANLRRVWLSVHAFERDAVQLAPKTPVRITLAAMPGREFHGTVALVGREVDASSRTLGVRVELPNADGALRPGMSATAHVPLQSGSRPVLTVPTASVQRVGEEWVVFTPMGEGAFQMRTIGRGRDLGAEIEALRGVAAGDTIVVDGAFLIKAEAEKAVGGDDHEHGN